MSLQVNSGLVKQIHRYCHLALAENRAVMLHRHLVEGEVVGKQCPLASCRFVQNWQSILMLRMMMMMTTR